MCTLTYVPHAKGYIVTINRDESPARNASELSRYKSGRLDFLIAREPVHGGTNLAISRKGEVTTLLNGAFKPYDPFLSYGRSRGLILLDSLLFETLYLFAEKHTLTNVEPFTLVRLGSGIDELRWDGQQAHFNQYDLTEPRIWASAQLYSIEFLKKREKWFADLLSGSADITAGLLKDFHLYGGEGDPANDMVMNRSDLVKTVSVSQATVQFGSVQISHCDLIGGKVNTYRSEAW